VSITHPTMLLQAMNRHVEFAGIQRLFDQVGDRLLGPISIWQDGMQIGGTGDRAGGFILARHADGLDTVSCARGQIGWDRFLLLHLINRFIGFRFCLFVASFVFLVSHVRKLHAFSLNLFTSSLPGIVTFFGLLATIGGTL